MRPLLLAGLLLAAFGNSGRRDSPPAPGVHLLPEEAWLYARTGREWWSAEIEDEAVYRVPGTDELKLQLTQPLSQFRVRVIDGQGRAIAHQAAVAMDEATSQQIHTLRFARRLDAGAYRIVIDAPLGGVLRDATGRRCRGQRFRILVQ